METASDSNKMEPKHEEYLIFGRQIGYVAISYIIASVLGIIQLPILTRGLGANLFGTWSLINSTVSMIVPFALLAFGSSIVRFLAAEKDTGKIRDDLISASSIVFFAGTAYSILLFLVSDYLAVSLFRDANSSYYIKLASFLILANAMQLLPLAYWRARGRIGIYTILNVAFNIIQFAFVSAAVLLGYRLTGAITAFLISGLLFDVISLLVTIKHTGFQLPKFSRIKPYMKYGLPLLLNPAIMWVITSGDRYLVNLFLGAAATGIYSAAYRVANYASLAQMPITLAMDPAIIKSYDEDDRSRTRNYLKYSLKYFLMVAIPSAFGLSVLATPLLRILTSDEFLSGNIIIAPIAFGIVFYCVFQILGNIIHLAKRTELMVWLLSATAVLNIVLNFILIRSFGIMGAAIATLIAYGALVLLTLAVTRRYLKFDLSLPFIAKSIFASGVMALAIWLLQPGSIPMVIISILAGIVIYFGALILIRGLSHAETRFFYTFARDNIRAILALK